MEQEKKQKVTYNLPITCLSQLDDYWAKLRKMLKGKKHITRSLIVEEAIKQASDDLERFGEESEFYKILAKNDEENLQEDLTMMHREETAQEVKTKATYYLGEEELKMLTDMYIKKLQDGNKGDRSEIIRDAIRLAHGQEVVKEEPKKTEPIEQRGRPKQLSDGVAKSTVTFNNSQIVWLDRLSADIRSSSMAILDRGTIIRAILTAIEKSNIDLLEASSEEQVCEMILNKLNNSEQESTTKGLPAGFVRATFIVKEDINEKIKALSYWERISIKDVVNEAFSQYLQGKSIKPIPKR
jgi:Arc/MetJ-type ribon-helix-helix transcriptional regulator